MNLASLKEIFFNFWPVIPLALFFYTAISFYNKRRSQKDKQLNKVVDQAIDEIKEDGAQYWLAKDQETRLMLATRLKYRLKLLGPLVQTLFSDPEWRQEALTLVKILRQHMTGGDFDYPSAEPTPDPEAVSRQAYDVAKLRLFIQAHAK